MGYDTLTNRSLINVNEEKPFKATMSMNNDIDKTEYVEGIAMSLAQKFNSKESFPFYCKVAYRLPENIIWNLYEQAQKGKHPARLFNWLCGRAIR